MRKIKIYSALLLMLAFTAACEKESIDSPDLEIAKEQEPLKFSEFVNSGIDVDKYFNDVLANEFRSKSSGKSHSDVSNEEELFDQFCSELPVEGFEKGRMDSDNAGIFNGPLNESTNEGKFRQNEILPGVSISAEGKVLGLYGQLVRHTESKVIYAQNKNADLFIDFTSGEVNSVSLDILSFPYSESDWTQEVTVDVYNTSGDLVHTETIEASIAGTSWSFMGGENYISRVALSSTNEDAWVGVDNIAFGECFEDADGDGCLDDEDPNDDSNFESTVNVGGCDSGVENRMTAACGLSLADAIDGLETGTYKNNGEAVRTVAQLAGEWVSSGLISSAEKDALVACAAKAGL